MTIYSSLHIATAYRSSESSHSLLQIKSSLTGIHAYCAIHALTDSNAAFDFYIHMAYTHVVKVERVIN